MCKNIKLNRTFTISAYFNAFAYNACLLIPFNALLNAVCLYNSRLFLFVYFALDHFIVNIYSMLFASMPSP